MLHQPKPSGDRAILGRSSGQVWGKERPGGGESWQQACLSDPATLPPSSLQAYTNKIAGLGPRRPTGDQAASEEVHKKIFYLLLTHWPSDCSPTLACILAPSGWPSCGRQWEIGLGYKLQQKEQVLLWHLQDKHIYFGIGFVKRAVICESLCQNKCVRL